MLINEVTVLGDKDHGKSTLIGNMLILTESASEDRIKNAKRASRQLGRKFEPGFLLDSFREEREGALTIDTTRAQIKYKETAFEFIDVPGHEELIKNMISGASNADFAILLISVKDKEGVEDQTKRHLFLAKMMGLRNIVVCVNKMDTVHYSRSVFLGVSLELEAFLLGIGVKKSGIFFVPISAYMSENILKKSKKMAWYKGESLLDILVKMSKNKKRKDNKDLRIFFQGSIEADGKKLYIGRILNGRIKENMKIAVVPSGNRFKVTSLFVKGVRRSIAKSGDNVALEIRGFEGLEYRGMIGCNIENVIQGMSEITSTIFITDDINKNLNISFNGVDYPCTIKVLNGIDTSTGKATGLKIIKPLEAAKVVIKLKKKIYFEPFGVLKELGRFTIYKDGTFVGIGVID